MLSTLKLREILTLGDKSDENAQLVATANGAKRPWLTLNVRQNFSAMKKSILPVILALGISAQALAASNADYPPISFVGPGKAGSSVDKTQFLVLVVEQGFISHNSTPIPQGGVVSYINSALKVQGASFLGVHIRQGIKFGDVIKALDELRKTEAKSIGVSMVELAPGKEP